MMNGNKNIFSILDTSLTLERNINKININKISILLTYMHKLSKNKWTFHNLIQNISKCLH